MKNLRLYGIMLGMVIMASLITYYAMIQKVKKIAMVDAVSLFNEFKMKKDLEKDYKNILFVFSTKVDSVERIIKLLDPKTKDNQQMAELYRAYDYYKAQYESEYSRSNQTINEQVWKRLNPLLEEYGKLKKYNIILGANGMGTVLYNDSYYDITKEVVEFVNHKYDNGK